MFKKAAFRASAIFSDFPKNSRLHLNFTKADEEAVCLQTIRSDGKSKGS